MSADRDRDSRGRARSARRRDDLGRPLPRSGDEPPPQEDPPPPQPADALRHAQRLLEAHRPFDAHEVLEAVWKDPATPGEARALWRGLAQLAVGLTHEQRGNHAGAVRLIERGALNLAPYAGTHPYGVDVDAVCGWAAAAAHDPARAGPPPLTPTGERQAAEDRS